MPQAHEHLDLLAAIVEGAFEAPLWKSFLDALRRKVSADYASLIFRPPDQPLNAACCAGLGVGAVLGPEERTPEAIRAAVRAVLADPTYRANAARVRDEMVALPGPEYAVALLERLARDKEPQLAPA